MGYLLTVSTSQSPYFLVGPQYHGLSSILLPQLNAESEVIPADFVLEIEKDRHIKYGSSCKDYIEASFDC